MRKVLGMALCLWGISMSVAGQSNSLIWNGSVKNYDKGRTGLSLVQPPAFSPDGKNVYIGAYDGFTWFSVNSTTGQLTWEGTLTDGGNGGDGVSDGHAVIVSPDGKYVYMAAGYMENCVTVYERKAGTGEPIYKAIYKEGTQGISNMKYPYGCAMDKNGDYLYIVNKDYDGNSIVWFKVDKATGLLTYAGKLVDDKDGVDGLKGAAQICLSPDGLHAYVAAFAENAVTWYDRNPNTGALTWKGMLVDGKNGVDGLEKVYWVEMHPSGKFLYTGAQDESAVAWFLIDGNGEPEYKGMVKDGNVLGGTRGLGLHPNGKWLYASASWSDCVVWFEIDQLTGKPSKKGHVKNAENGVAGIDGTRYLAVSPDGGMVVATGYDGNSVAWFGWDGEKMPLGLSEPITKPQFQIIGHQIKVSEDVNMVQLYDISGRLIWQTNAHFSSLQFPQHLTGIHIVHVISANSDQYRKVFIQP